MTKQRTKKATQQRVTTGTFLKVAKFMGVSRTTREKGKRVILSSESGAFIASSPSSLSAKSNLSRYNVPDSLLSQRYRRKMRLP